MTDTDPLYGTAGHGRMSLNKIKDDVKFYPHQLDGVRTLARRTSFLLADEMGGGKAQPIGTSVATPTGWRPIGALQVGDTICRPAGGTQHVLRVHPQGRIAVARVTFADGTHTLASWDHLWTVSGASGDWRILTTRELHTHGLGASEGRPHWEVPLPRPVSGAGPGLPGSLDPFTLGFILAGGLSLKEKTGGLNRGRVALGRHEAAKMLKVPGCRLVYEDGCWMESEPATPDGFANFMNTIGQLGIHRQTGKRSYPEDMRFASEADRMRFFLGVVAAVGCVIPETQHRFGLRLNQNTTPSVLNGLLELIRLLGGVAMADNVTKWISIWWPTPLRLWSGTTISTPRPVKSIVGIGPAGMSECVCITVDDDEGLYVSEQGIVTHNSLQALTVAAIDYQIGHARKSLIVCPMSLKDNWAAEIRKYTTFNAVVCNGTKPQREKLLEKFRQDPAQDVMICNYEQVVGHLDLINACDLDVLIFDEAHYLKTNKSQRTKACHKIASRRSFMLTGSPMLNQPQELWGILHGINPEEFPSFWKFSQRFCVFGGYKAKQVTGVKNRIELLEILDRYMLRRLKTEMITLPDKNFIPVRVPLSDLQRRLYTEAETELQLMIPDQLEPMELENALTKMLRLKQITGTPATLGFDDSSIKLDRVIEIVQQLADDGEKVVVFTQFRGVLAALENRLAVASIPVWPLSGDTPGPKRQPLVDDWTASSKPGVLLAMLQVGGVGLDFTAASNVIFVDKLYVPAMNDQAVDRLHRLSMDKTKQVNIYEMLCTKTVEDRVEKILEAKRKMTKAVIDNAQFRKLVIQALHEQD